MREWGGEELRDSLLGLVLAVVSVHDDVGVDADDTERVVRHSERPVRVVLVVRRVASPGNGGIRSERRHG